MHPCIGARTHALGATHQTRIMERNDPGLSLPTYIYLRAILNRKPDAYIYGIDEIYKITRTWRNNTRNIHQLQSTQDRLQISKQTKLIGLRTFLVRTTPLNHHGQTALHEAH